MQDITSISWLLDREPVATAVMVKASIVSLSLFAIILWSLWEQWTEADQ